MISNPADLLSASITENTRFAIRPLERDVRFISGVNRAAIELSNASLDLGLERGITRHVAICEEKIVRLTPDKDIRCEMRNARPPQHARKGGYSVRILGGSAASLEKLAWAKNHFAAA